MNECYKQGFIDKCAEMGIDPEHLYKVAARGDKLVKYLKQMAEGESVHRSNTGRALQNYIRLNPEVLASKGEKAEFIKHHATSGKGQWISHMPKEVDGYQTRDALGYMKSMARHERAEADMTKVKDKVNKRLTEGEKK